MAILSEYEEEDHNKPSSSAASAKKPFNAALDPLDPLGFLEKVFEFVAKESDLFKSDSLVADVNAVVRVVKDKVEAGEKKRKEGKVEAGKVEKKTKEVAAPVPPKKEEVKEDVMEENGSGSKAEEEKGPRGKLLSRNFTFPIFWFHLNLWFAYNVVFLLCYYMLLLDVIWVWHLPVGGADVGVLCIKLEPFDVYDISGFTC